MLAYQGSDLETQNLSKVKAHDVRSIAASLAFKGGVSLDQILGACFRKSHTTFTNFYLKDVAWKSKEGSEYSLGSVVSYSSIVVCIAYIYKYKYNSFLVESCFV